jgi:hypothetical protein
VKVIRRWSSLLDVEHDRAEADEFLAELVAVRRIGDAGERAARAAGAEQARGR